MLESAEHRKECAVAMRFHQVLVRNSYETGCSRVMGGIVTASQEAFSLKGCRSIARVSVSRKQGKGQ